MFITTWSTRAPRPEPGDANLNYKSSPDRHPDDHADHHWPAGHWSGAQTSTWIRSRAGVDNIMLIFTNTLQASTTAPARSARSERRRQRTSIIITPMPSPARGPDRRRLHGVSRRRAVTGPAPFNHHGRPRPPAFLAWLPVDDRPIAAHRRNQ